MKTIKFITNVIDKICKAAGVLAAAMVFPITCIAGYEVFMRYMMNKPTIWAWDLNMQLFAALIMLGGAYTLREGGHVSVDVLVAHLSVRRRALVNMIIVPIFLIGIIILLYKSGVAGWESFGRKEEMPTVWGPPLWTIKMWIPIGAFLMLLQVISMSLKDLANFFLPTKISK